MLIYNLSIGMIGGGILGTRIIEFGVALFGSIGRTGGLTVFIDTTGTLSSLVK